MLNLGVPNVNPCSNFDVKSGLSLSVYVTIDIHVYFTWISVEEVYSHASNANASMTP